MWKRPVWREKRVLPPTRSRICASGPAFALAQSASAPRTAIDFHVTSGEQRGVTARSWTLNALPEIEDFTFDWYQDLLVLAESCSDRDELTIHLLRCSTGEPYPLIQQNTLRATLPTVDPLCTVNLHVCGELLAVEYIYEDMFHKIMVWNWRQGSLLLHLDEEPSQFDGGLISQGCALLDNRYVLIAASGFKGVSVLAVFDSCAPHPSERLIFQDALDEHASLVLSFPRIHGDISEDPIVDVSCQPDSPCALPAQLAGVAFRSATPPVVLVEVCTLDTEGAAALYNLLIPGRFILSQLADVHADESIAAVRQLPWQTYAHECRMFEITHGPGGSVNGARYVRSVTVAQGNNPPVTADVVHIYHFGEPGLACSDEDRDPDQAPSVRRILAPSDASDAKV
ncbi:hypothetical protein PsYK624_103390 [Phanerochaete sordida]|uniref:Uncharacterized protein n=1 Tax=Phanerochaete sordida TaxID=48140 RepID=A0A9P3GG47_9APHY|nr:hypothetical protein PsYK624_103390 [Phanerochaete sordida]